MIPLQWLLQEQRYTSQGIHRHYPVGVSLCNFKNNKDILKKESYDQTG